MREDEILDKAFLNKVWITSNDEMIPLSEMTNSHIENCILCMENDGLPEEYFRWLPLMKEELKKRSLKEKIAKL